MFGLTMKVGWGDLHLILRPMKKEEVPYIAEMYSRAKVHEYTLGYRGVTVEQEEAWREEVMKSNDTMQWVIEPVGHDKAIGVTGIDSIDHNQSCTSGIIIFDPEWWNEGVASRTHLARTYWAVAAKHDRATIKSEVLKPNVASKKALLKVGYTVTGVRPRCYRVGTEYVDALLLTWINPIWVPRLYPDGVPEEYKEGIKKAEMALERAKEVIEL